MYNPQPKTENVVNWPNYYLDSVKNRVMMTSVNQNEVDNTISMGLDSSVHGKNEQGLSKKGNRSRKASSRRNESDAVSSSTRMNKNKKDIAEIIRQHDLLQKEVIRAEQEE